MQKVQIQSLVLVVGAYVVKSRMAGARENEGLEVHISLIVALKLKQLSCTNMERWCSLLERRCERLIISGLTWAHVDTGARYLPGTTSREFIYLWVSDSCSLRSNYFPRMQPSLALVFLLSFVLLTQSRNTRTVFRSRTSGHRQLTCFEFSSFKVRSLLSLCPTRVKFLKFEYL